MLLIISRNEDRPELESKILAAAFRQSVELGDIDGSRLAHRELVGLLARKAQQSARATDKNGDQVEHVFASEPLPLDLQELGNKVRETTDIAHKGDNGSTKPEKPQELKTEGWIDMSPSGVETTPLDEVGEPIEREGSFYDLVLGSAELNKEPEAPETEILSELEQLGFDMTVTASTDMDLEKPIDTTFDTDMVPPPSKEATFVKYESSLDPPVKGKGKSKSKGAKGKGKGKGKEARDAEPEKEAAAEAIAPPPPTTIEAIVPPPVQESKGGSEEEPKVSGDDEDAVIDPAAFLSAAWSDVGVEPAAQPSPDNYALADMPADVAEALADVLAATHAEPFVADTTADAIAGALAEHVAEALQDSITPTGSADAPSASDPLPGSADVPSASEQSADQVINFEAGETPAPGAETDFVPPPAYFADMYGESATAPTDEAPAVTDNTTAPTEAAPAVIDTTAAPASYPPPPDYLDFSAPQTPDYDPTAAQEAYSNIDFGAAPEDEPAHSSQESVASLLQQRPIPDPDSPSYYPWIGAEPTDPFWVLHICYQRAVRRLLRRQADKGTALNSHDFKRQLKNMGIAYNILYEPRTRLDFDLRQLGLREPDAGTGLTVPADAKLPEAGGKAKIAFSELLIVCRIFDFEQMLAIVNAARLLDEQRFWAYLGDSGLLTGVELDSIKTGFQFICNGLISIYQYEQAFQYARTHQQQLLEILLAAGWVRLEDLQEFANADLDALPEAPKFVEASVKRQEAPVSGIQVAATMPSWMEWGSSEDSPAEATGDQESASATELETTAPPAIPDGSVLDESAPDESAPEESAPDKSAPDKSAPDKSAPDKSAPDKSVPDESVPDESDTLSIDFANMATKAADASLKQHDSAADDSDMIQSVPSALSDALSAAQAQAHADEAADESPVIEVPHSLEEELSAAQSHSHDDESEKSPDKDT